MMRTRPRLHAAVALLAALALALAACGDDSADDDAATDSEAAVGDATANGDGEGDATGDDSSGDGGSETDDGASEAGDSDDSTGDDTSTGAAAVADPCTLLSASDLQTVTGVTFEEGLYNEALSDAQRQICDWLTPAGAEIANAQVLLVPDASVYDGSRTPDATDVTVAGADEAYAIDDGKIVGVKVGDLFVQVAYLPADGAGRGDETVALADIAVGNL